MCKKRIYILGSTACMLFFFVLLFRHIPTNENEKFENYTDQLFCQEVASSTISLHYTLKHPDTYGIDEIPVSLGSLPTDPDAVCASAENALSVLHFYKRERLSEENRQTYDILESHWNTALKEGKYLLYDEPLAPLTGAQSQLPIVLSEYRFYDTADCETYLELLTRVPEYFHSIIEFEQAKSDAGLFMASYNADALIEECETFIEMGSSNYLYTSFEERLAELDLPEKESAHLIDTNQQNIENYVFPAYEELCTALSALRDTGTNTEGLCYLPDGDKYYEQTVAAQTGSSRSIPELQKLTLSQMAEDSAALQEMFATLSEESANSGNESSNILKQIFETDNAAFSSQPETILNHLENKLSGSFPQPPGVSTQVKYVQESMEDYLSPAFYMIPAIDDTKNNVIYINQGHIPDDLTLFTTLAHEGYPGHLYQTTYYASTNPTPIRNLLDFGGYTEGWATYAEMMSYYLAPISEERAVLMQRNSSIILGLYALADMGIHYDGWSLMDTISFFRDYGITDTETIEEIYELIIADPGNYLKYYIGYVEFLELKKDAIKAWGEDFSQERFHKEVLEIGPAPFDVLRKEMFGDRVK